MSNYTGYCLAAPRLKERRFARYCRKRLGSPEFGLVDLGGAPKSVKSEEGRQWPYRGDATGLAERIVRETNR